MIQKALIHSGRAPEEQVKDLFYVVELLDRENGLSARSLADVLAADARWRSGVDQLADMLANRTGEARFLAAVAEQYPVERRPLVAYIEREVGTWIDHLQRARRGGTRGSAGQ